ncbi:MAG TPA: ThiF family adenylyltransferase [Fermentimonas sp.]|nr:ThiF family adenylyltransferase [Fermentimonas sp.]
MSQQLISLNSDLKQLRDEGFHIEVYGGHLIVRHIPFVNSNREVKMGTFVSTLCLSGNKTSKPDTHVMLFSGEQPCDKNGKVIQAIVHSNANNRINDVVVQRQFSNKPKGGYKDYYEKVSTYANIISSPAKALDETVTERPFKPIVETDEKTNFKYFDTNSSRSNLSELTEKFSSQKIAIIGLGGTGSYILDFVAKTNVKEVHLFDGDVFLNHNAFRAPGAPSLETLEKRMSKVEYFKQIYTNMHKGVIAHQCYVGEDNLHLLKDMDYVFLSLDNNQARNEIIDYLLKEGISFVDVGMGIQLAEDKVLGILRTTSSLKGSDEHLANRIPKGSSTADNAYTTNIQIAELNAMNAVFAIIKWKKMSGFYQDYEQEQHLTYSINVSQLLNDDCLS